MSGETEKNVSGWTVDTIKEYFERRLSDADKGMEKAFASAQRVIEVSEKHADEWRKSANEWRQTLSDRESRFAAKSEMDVEFRSLTARVDILEKSKEAVAGERRGQQGALVSGRAWLATLATFLTIVGIVGGYLAKSLIGK